MKSLILPRQKGMFSTGDVLQKAFLRIWFSCNAAVKLHDLTKTTEAAIKHELFPGQLYLQSLQTGTGSKFRLGRRRKSQEVSCRLGFHGMGVGRSWVNSYKPTTVGTKKSFPHWEDGHRAERRASNLFSVGLLIN